MLFACILLLLKPVAVHSVPQCYPQCSYNEICSMVQGSPRCVPYSDVAQNDPTRYPPAVTTPSACPLPCQYPLVCSVLQGYPRCVPSADLAGLTTPLVMALRCPLTCAYPLVCQVIQGKPYCVPSECGDNEEVNVCGAHCENKCASFCQLHLCTPVCGPPACACKYYFYRNSSNGKCVAMNECPACPHTTKAPLCNIYCPYGQKCQIVHGKPICQPSADATTTASVYP